MAYPNGRMCDKAAQRPPRGRWRVEWTGSQKVYVSTPKSVIVPQGEVVLFCIDCRRFGGSVGRGGRRIRMQTPVWNSAKAHRGARRAGRERRAVTPPRTKRTVGEPQAEVREASRGLGHTNGGGGAARPPRRAWWHGFRQNGRKEAEKGQGISGILAPEGRGTAEPQRDDPGTVAQLAVVGEDPFDAAAGLRANRKWNVVPLPGSVSKSRAPSWNCMMR